ncbi:hypothetical protein [Legionella sainthelensi]|uniref:hypothetical protein n=1 Tax=Legionella sainthelensi TaxID=28087 RepID=UPI000E20B28D|nr:hypothetical protein [Legionella sainthelensi]
MYNKFEKELTTYCVNDIECERDTIYQMIQNKKLYDETLITLKKRHQLEHHESNIFERRGAFSYYRNENSSKRSKDRTARVSLNTKVFADKVGHDSIEFEQLIEKMINFVDIFFESSKDYSVNSQKQREIIRDLLNFYYQYTLESDNLYNDFFKALIVEYMIFLFDMLALGISEGKSSNQSRLPPITFASKEWDEKASTIKKSQALHEYLTVLLQMTEQFLTMWLQSDMFDQDTKHKIKCNFEDFKKIIRDFQTHKISLDNSLNTEPQQTSLFTNMYSFYRQSQSNREVHVQYEPRMGPG